MRKSIVLFLDRGGLVQGVLIAHKHINFFLYKFILEREDQTIKNTFYINEFSYDVFY